jgi:TetR/AcrR family transcriptional regulator, cholesterol catabolism regulator
LIGVATELFAANGYEATAIPAVLQAAGVSRGAFYHHFESKEDSSKPSRSRSRRA